MSDAHDRLRTLYDQMWSRAMGKIRAGRIERDPVLQGGLPDQRRGLTVIARPSPAVRRCVADFLRELRRLEPDQYYYTHSEFHVTVLSLFTATTDHRPFFAQMAQYLSAVDAALKVATPLCLNFKGVTASPGAVMIQGFLENETLNNLRDLLRTQLQCRRLGAAVDQRYRLRTVHMTVVRFRSPLADSRRFAAAIESARQRFFGATTVRSLNLVENDWYMSHCATKTLKRYRLTTAK